MQCNQFREICLADPCTSDEQFQAHGEGCPECAKFHGDQVAFQKCLCDALEVRAPVDLTRRLRAIPEQSSTSRPMMQTKQVWFAMAASLLIIFGVVTNLVLRETSTIQAPLDRAVVAHIHEESDALVSNQPVDQGEIRDLLQKVGADLVDDLHTVKFAKNCRVRSEAGVHLVMSGEQGPVTIMIVPDETVVAEQQVVDERFVGRLIPLPQGTLAILGEKGESIASVREEFQQSVIWL